jgi:hypothetical protein
LSHTYLVSTDAPERIYKHLPNAKLLACLRDPVQRTFSDYLDGLKVGKFSGSFEEELVRTPALIDRSRYGTQLGRYLQKFDRDQILISSFDELVSAPNLHAARMFEFLGVDVLEIPAGLRGKILPAGIPRSRSLAAAARHLSKMTRDIGLDGLRGKVKTSTTVRNLLYRPYREDSRPTMALATEAHLREIMAEEVQLLDAVAGTDFCGLWGYSPLAQPRVTPIEAGRRPKIGIGPKLAVNT